MHVVTNPKDSFGNVMECHECASADHLIANCPTKRKGKGGQGQRYLTQQEFSSSNGVGTQQSQGQTSQSSLSRGAGMLQGIVNGSSDNWFGFIDDHHIEEVADDDHANWLTVHYGGSNLDSNSVPTGCEIFALEDEPEPQPRGAGIRNSSMLFPSWRVEDMREKTDEKEGEAYLVRTRMATASGAALLIDPGSPENLCGDQWSKEMQAAAAAANRPPTQFQDMHRPLEVGGIGSGTQKAFQTGRHPIGLSNGDEAVYEAPILPNSGTPALLGQKSLKKMRGLLDCFNKKLYRIGPGGYRMQLSPGSVVYALEESHAGHLMLPCSRFSPHIDSQKTVEVFAAGDTTDPASSSVLSREKQADNKSTSSTVRPESHTPLAGKL